MRIYWDDGDDNDDDDDHNELLWAANEPNVIYCSIHRAFSFTCIEIDCVLTALILYVQKYSHTHPKRTGRLCWVSPCMYVYVDFWSSAVLIFQFLMFASLLFLYFLLSELTLLILLLVRCLFVFYFIVVVVAGFSSHFSSFFRASILISNHSFNQHNNKKVP